jgi:hypothetical protein
VSSAREETGVSVRIRRDARRAERATGGKRTVFMMYP